MMRKKGIQKSIPSVWLIIYDPYFMTNFSALLEANPLKCKNEKVSGKTCNGLVKPDIVFFGEGLPQKFFAAQNEDLEKARVWKKL